MVEPHSPARRSEKNGRWMVWLQEGRVTFPATLIYPKVSLTFHPCLCRTLTMAPTPLDPQDFLGEALCILDKVGKGL